jgi:hypothetical protein
MALNSFIVTDLAVNGLAAGLEGESEFLGTVGTRLSKEFARDNLDVGQTINEVLPPRPNPWIEGRVQNPSASVYEQVSTTVIQRNTSRMISDADLQLSRREFFEEVIMPDVNGGVREAERNSLEGIQYYPSMSNISSVGVDPTNSAIWGQTRAMYRMMLGPNKDIFGIMDPLTMQALANNEAKLFRPNTTVDVAALEGRVNTLVGVGDMYDSVNLHNFTNGDGKKVIAVNGANQTGTSLICDGASSGTTYKKGQQFYFSDTGVGAALDPEKHFALPFKQTFTLSQDCVISGGAVTLVFGPSIIIDGSLQDQLAAPPDGAVVTFLGDPSTTYKQHWLYNGGQRGAIQFVGLSLPTFEGRGGQSKMKTYKDVPLRSVYFTKYDEGQNYLRMDMMTGISTRRWQHVWRFWGEAVA